MHKIRKMLMYIIGIFIGIALIVIGTNYAIAISTDVGSIADSAANNSGDFWKVKAGARFLNETNVYEKRQWMCLTEKKNTGIGMNGIRARTVIDINGNGTYTTQIYGGNSVTNRNNTYEAKKLAYLCYAATIDGDIGLVGGDSINNGPRNALYAYYNGTDLYSLIGPFSNKRTNDYLAAARQTGATVLRYADTYANSETKGSSATISDKKDAGAEVKVAVSNGKSYSYIGPFSMKTAGSISSVSITDGSTSANVSGYSNSVGGTVQKVSNIPRNGNNFYVVTDKVLTNLNIKVKIKTSGSAGGGTITDPRNGSTSKRIYQG